MKTSIGGNAETVTRKTHLLAGIVLLFAWLAVHSTSTFAASVGQNAQGGKQNTAHSTALTGSTSQQIGCVMAMLKASSVSAAKNRRAACPDPGTFIVRASYAWWLTQHHAPGAVDAVISAAPKSSAEMNEFYDFAGYSQLTYEDAVLADRTNTNYYDALFRAAEIRPAFLPTLMLIAAQFGTDNPNVDEYNSFCDELQKVYQKMPKRYMEALSRVTNIYARRYALACRSGS